MKDFSQKLLFGTRSSSNSRNNRMHSDTNGRTKSNNSPSDNNPNETVILIDSDKEEDASIREANLPVRLYPDRRVGDDVML